MADAFDVVYGKPRKKKKQPLVTAATPEEEPGIIASLGNNALSGLSFVGNVLDTPGSWLRNSLVGENPFKGTFDPEQRTSGRDVLEQAGILDPNEEGADLGDVAGFAAEIATDPLTYMTLGGSALTKVGRALKNAGMLDDASRVASKLAGKEVGKRVARLTLTPDQLLSAMPEKTQAFKLAAEKLGLDPAKIGGERIGGMVGFGAPFGNPLVTAGTGKTAQKVAAGMDKVGDVLRYGKLPFTDYSPGMHAAELFNYAVQGANTKDTQKAYEWATRQAEQGSANVDLLSHMAAHQANTAGLADDAGSDILRSAVEMPGSATPQAKKIVKPLTDYTQEELWRKQAEGLGTQSLHDLAGVQYHPRRITKNIGSNGGLSNLTGKVTSPDDIARIEQFKGIHGGTETIRTIAKDKQVQNLKELIDGGALKPSDLEDYIRQNYGPKFVNQDLVQPFSESIRKIDKQTLESGLFGNHMIVDFQTHGHGAERSIANAKAAKEVIEKHATTVPQFDPATHVRVSDVMEKLGFDKNAFPQYQNTDVANVVLPMSEAKSLLRTMDQFKAPKEFGKLVGALDSFTNLWKAGVLTRPARYVRDLASGTTRGVEEGVVNLRGFNAFHDMIAGKSVKGAEQIPYVAQLLKKYNLPDSEATDVLRSIVAANGMAGNKQASGHVVGNLQPTVTGGLEDLLGARPGHHPLKWGDTLKPLIGKDPDATWNPFKSQVRGVKQAAKSTFAPVKAGEVAGWYTDSANRVPGFIELLWQGVDPHTAATRINDAQVNYASRTFTPFERDVMKRVAPFYSFTRKQAPYVAKTLAERPGGMLAQEIRGLNQAGKDQEPLPDKVTQGTAIPLGTQEDGTKRFLTSTGNMAEDVLTLGQIGDSLGDTIGKTGRQILGRAHPLLKLPIELSTRKLLFSGQDLQDADPSIGRAYSNIKDNITGERTIDAAGKDSDLASLGEYGAGFIPGVSSIANAVRTGTDPRKSLSDKAINLLTGAKVTDVSPKTSEAVLIERATEKLKKSGGKILETPYVPQYKRDSAAPGELTEADKILGLLKLHDQRRNQEKAKAKKKKTPMQAINDLF